MKSLMTIFATLLVIPLYSQNTNPRNDATLLWAKKENMLLPLYGLGISDFNSSWLGGQSIDIPDEIGNYEGKIPNKAYRYSEFVRNHYCPNQRSHSGSMGTYYLIGTFVNKSHYKKDKDIFVAKINDSIKEPENKIIWIKSYSNENSNGHTNDYGICMFPTKDKGFVIASKIEDEAVNLFIKADSLGNELWRQKIPLKTIGSSYKNFPLKIIEDKDFNIVCCLGDETQFEQTTQYSFLKLSGQTGNIIWQKELSKDSKITVDGLYGGFIEIPNEGYAFIINFETIDDSNSKRVKSRGVDDHSYYNVGAIILDYSGNAKKIFTFLSDESKYVNFCYYRSKSNTIKCEGRRGTYNVDYGMNYLQRKELKWSAIDTEKNKSFFIEFDLNGKIISTNGIDN